MTLCQMDEAETDTEGEDSCGLQTTLPSAGDPTPPSLRGGLTVHVQNEWGGHKIETNIMNTFF